MVNSRRWSARGVMRNRSPRLLTACSCPATSWNASRGCRRISAAPVSLSVDSVSSGRCFHFGRRLSLPASRRAAAITLHRRLGKSRQAVLVEADDTRLDGLLGVALLSPERSIVLLIAGHGKPPPRLTTSCRRADLATVSLVAVREFKRLDHSLPLRG